MSLILRIPKDLHTQFKEYCIKRNITMSTVLIDYITTLLPKNTEILPGEQKNTVVYHCPYCGMDITDKPGSDRLFHLQNCKNSQNG